MFYKKTVKVQPSTQDLIDEVYTQLQSRDAESDEYEKLLTRAERLHKLQSQEKGRKLSADTAAIVAGNLLGIGAILFYEQAHVIGSKALGFVLKSKI